MDLRAMAGSAGLAGSENKKALVSEGSVNKEALLRRLL
jgi:hypothetical protein